MSEKNSPIPPEARKNQERKSSPPETRRSEKKSHILPEARRARIEITPHNRGPQGPMSWLTRGDR